MSLKSHTSLPVDCTKLRSPQIHISTFHFMLSLLQLHPSIFFASLSLPFSHFLSFSLSPSAPNT